MLGHQVHNSSLHTLINFPSELLISHYNTVSVSWTYVLTVRRAPLWRLQSLTSGGIRAARYDSFRRMIAQTYGYQHLYTLSNLEKAGECCVG
jgi:hypothetical protein